MGSPVKVGNTAFCTGRTVWDGWAQVRTTPCFVADRQRLPNESNEQVSRILAAEIIGEEH